MALISTTSFHEILLREIKKKTQHSAKPFGRLFETLVDIEDTKFRLCVLETKHLKDNWRFLSITTHGSIYPPIILQGVHEIRHELMEYFNVQSIHFPTAYQREIFETIPPGWTKTSKCLFFGLVSCTFYIFYDVEGEENPYFFELQIGVNSFENPTFDALSERLKQMILEPASEETDDNEEEEKENADHDSRFKKRLRKLFRELFSEDFLIADFAFQKDFFYSTQTIHDFAMEETLFSYSYKTFYESLCFKAKVIPQRLIDEYFGYQSCM